MSAVWRIRDREKAGFEERYGVKLTFLPFFVRTTGDLANRTDVFMARIAATSGTAESSPAPKRLEPMPQLAHDAQFHRRSLDNLRRARDARAMR